MNEWIEHDGSGMPVDGGVMVDVRFRDGSEHDRPYPAGTWGRSSKNSSLWDHSNPSSSDIVAYRIVEG